jgi:pimeloyl-ACP methyl ester carboxylesterase
MNSASKKRGRRLLAVAGFLAVLVAATAPASAAPQQKAAQPSTTAVAVATDQSHKPSTKPTLVLVHGAWADGSSWSKVTRRLQNDGFTVRVPPNPLRSLPGDAATIRDFLSTLSGPIVLVAHSYGGAVITNAATGNPNVKALVYVDALGPPRARSSCRSPERTQRWQPIRRPSSTSSPTPEHRPATSTCT